MSIKSSEVSSIQLNGAINLNEIKTNIQPYDRLNSKQGIFLGDCLTNIYEKPVKDYGYEEDTLVQQYKDDWIRQMSGQFYYGYDFISSFENQHFQAVKTTKIDYSENLTIKNIDFTSITVAFRQRDYVINVNGAYSFGICENGQTAYITAYNGEEYITVQLNNGIQTEISNKLVVSGKLIDDISFADSTATFSDCVHQCSNLDGSHKVIYADSENSYVKNYTNILMGAENYWNRGAKIPSLNGYAVLYYANQPYAISRNNSVVVNIAEITAVSESKIWYRDDENNLMVLTIEDGCLYSNIIKDRYILINTTSYNNTIDLYNMTTFCRSDDYNDRLMPVGAPGNEWYIYGTGHNESVESSQKPYFSSIFPSLAIKGKPTGYANYINSEIVDVNIYLSSSAGNPAVYSKTLSVKQRFYISNDLSGRIFPDTSGNVLYNTAVLEEPIDTYLEKIIFKDSSFSFISQINSYQNMIFGHYSNTYTTLTDLFMVQGNYYGIQDNFIISLLFTNNVLDEMHTVCNKSDMKYIGATPEQALFYSPVDKSIYAFTGDQRLTKILDCFSITDIYSFYNNPANSLICISTNIGVLVAYNEQIFELGINTKDSIYYTNNSLIINGNEYCFYQREGYKKLPVIIETEFYGIGNNYKSVNDCIYIRLNDKNKQKGRLKIKSFTLNETSSESDEKTFDISNNMWDSQTDTIFIRYQPRFQSSAGFKVRIESDFPVSTLDISHKAETIQNSKFNL